MRLLLGVNEEVLGLGLRELAQADHPLSGRDLVSVGFADLGRPEGQAVAVEPEQASEVGEDPLRRLGPEIPRPLRTRPDRGLKRQREPEDLDRAEPLAAGRTVEILAGRGRGRPRRAWLRSRTFRRPRPRGRPAGTRRSGGTGASCRRSP